MNLFASHITPTPITQALHQASAETGVGFDYLFKTAYRESNLEPGAAASTSSATGLFQFVESTWLQMVKEEGPKFGLGQYAQQVQKGADGRYHVADPKARASILKLRTDPEISALMAGALTRRNGEHLAQQLGREPSGGELYIAHFLGSGEAGRLLRMAENSPDASAAEAFPRAAKSNPAIFYAAGGQPRSVSQVRDELVSRHEGSSGIARFVARIERKVTTFFASLFHMISAPDEGSGVAPGGTPDSLPSPHATAFRAPRADEIPLLGRSGAHQRLAANAAYDSQLDWLARQRRPEDPVFTP